VDLIKEFPLFLSQEFKKNIKQLKQQVMDEAMDDEEPTSGVDKKPKSVLDRFKVKNKKIK
jgi:hypothetical protein